MKSDELRRAFIAGYWAGWDTTGEGHNAEYSRRTPEEMKAEIARKADEWLTANGEP